MRRFALVLPLLGAVLLLGVVTAQASNNATWNVSYSVATTTSLVNNTANASFGVVVPGTLSTAIHDDLTISSNDPSGVQLVVASVGPTVESGASPCVPQATRTASGSSIQITPTATTGGTGGVAGTPMTPFFLSTATQNLFSANPTATGTLDENLTAAIDAPTTIQPNSNGCSYTLPLNYTLIAQ